MSRLLARLVPSATPLGGQNPQSRLLYASVACPNTLCHSCLLRLRQPQKRCATTAASTIQDIHIEHSPSGQATPALTPSESRSVSYQIKAAVLLSRPPLLIRELTPFEKAFFLYQRRLNERLALPFTRYFYYQKGTPGDIEWKRKIKQRLTAARDIGNYTGYSKETWNDEILVGDNLSEPQQQVEALIRDAEDREGYTESETARKKEEVVDRPVTRETEADQKNDKRSLNRLLSRTLYLIVKARQLKKNQSHWIVPEVELLEKESLRSAAERVVSQTGGMNMNTWVIGNMPVGHQVHNHPNATTHEPSATKVKGEKTFYMKARIMDGQVNLEDNSLGIEDFHWATMDEMQKSLHPRDFAAVRSVLVER